MPPLVNCTPFTGPRSGIPSPWEEKTSAPFTLTTGHRAMWLLPDGNVLASSSGNDLQVAIYNTSNDSWQLKNTFPVTYNTPMPVFHPSTGNPVMVGSSTPSQGHIYEYNISGDSWANVATWSVNHRNAGFANMSNGDIIAMSSQQTTNRRNVTSWDGTTFTGLDPIPNIVGSPGGDVQGRNVCFTADNGDVYGLGFYGYAPGGVVQRAIFKYEPSPTNVTSQVSNLTPEFYYSPAVARISGNRVMLIGGNIVSGQSQKVYIFDMNDETFTEFPYDFAQPAEPAGLTYSLTNGNHAVTLADGRVMGMTNNDRVFITQLAP